LNKERTGHFKCSSPW